MSTFNALAGAAGTAVPNTGAHAPKPQPAGPVQADGNIVPQQAKPTKAPLQSRQASPANLSGSGMETAMGALADKLHPRRGR